jgi:hypothetical protein
LLYLLGVDKNDAAKVAAVQDMMAKSGLRHSVSADNDREQWLWKGEQRAITGSRGSFPVEETVDLTSYNMGRSINLGAIAELFNTIGSSGNDISNFVNGVYISPIKFLNYADTGGNLNIGLTMLSGIYNQEQMNMITVNRAYENNVLKYGQDIRQTMYSNAVTITQPFGITAEESGYIDIHKANDPNAPYYLKEDHPAIDYGSGGSTVRTPGGYWVYDGTQDYNVMFQLYGSDVRMRINHVDTTTIAKNYTLEQIVGSATGTAYLFNYPQILYGTGDGPHTHTEYTRYLPYNGTYMRQFVNPNTLMPQAGMLEYYLNYYDKDKIFQYQRHYNRDF